MARAFDPMQNVPSWKSVVARSQAYYMSMRGSTQFNVIHSYRGDVDPDDWLRAPLLVSYKIMNWAIKQINKKNNAGRGLVSSRKDYVPELLTSSGLKQSRINQSILESQVEHAKILENTLYTFPRLERNEGMTVYRGETCNSFYYEKASRMREGGVEELVILPFLSTSINRHVATRFSGNVRNNNSCVWEITIPPGQIFPYVSELVPGHLGNEASAGDSEQEVLFPTHARLLLISKSVDQSPNVYRFQLVGFAEKAPDFWDRALANLVDILPMPLRSRPKRAVASKSFGGARKTTKTRKLTKNNRRSRRKTRK